MAEGAGRVFLVGAGPGAPDLITVRGERALRGADAVVYDALASAELISLAPPHALRIDVGKRGHDAPTRSQEDINALLVRLAREGRRVVRLKGGDPFVFGRGGEEASACLAAGVPFEVVPGVSSAVGALAYAGIPVTDRRYAASFAVVTGHKDPTPAREQLRWAELARGADTLVILMGMRHLAEIVTRLVEGGRSPQTPAAAVMNGSLASQRVVAAPLGELAERVASAGLAAPAVVVVGEVVALRGAGLAWFEGLPLFGRRVAVTRQPAQADAWCRALQEAGAEPLRASLIRTVAVRDAPGLAAAVAARRHYDLLVLTSANAATGWAERVREAGGDPAEGPAQVRCVGVATAEAARRAGLPAGSVAAEGSDAEALLRALEGAGGLRGARVLLPRAERARAVLPDGLRRAGARVDEVVVYRTEADPAGAAVLASARAAGALDAVAFASPSAARALAEASGAGGLEALAGVCVAAIGRVTAEALRELGRPADVVAERPEAGSLVDALAAYFEGRPRPGEEEKG